MHPDVHNCLISIDFLAQNSRTACNLVPTKPEVKSGSTSASTEKPPGPNLKEFFMKDVSYLKDFLVVIEEILFTLKKLSKLPDHNHVSDMIINKRCNDAL